MEETTCKTCNDTGKVTITIDGQQFFQDCPDCNIADTRAKEAPIEEEPLGFPFNLQ